MQYEMIMHMRDVFEKTKGKFVIPMEGGISKAEERGITDSITALGRVQPSQWGTHIQRQQ